MATPHIESKKEDIAKVVLMPGDPLRAKFIAENFLENAKLVNSVRNMLAYTGTYKGKEVTVFASGMGMPSIGIYSYELFKEYDVDITIVYKGFKTLLTVNIRDDIDSITVKELPRQLEHDDNTSGYLLYDGTIEINYSNNDMQELRMDSLLVKTYIDGTFVKNVNKC